MKRKLFLAGSLLLPTSIFAFGGNFIFREFHHPNNSIFLNAKISTENENIVSLPYSEHFDTKEAFNKYKIIDANNDDNTWKLDKGKVDYFTDFFNDNPGDDWIITPGFKLEAGKKYTFSFTAKNDDDVEKLEAFIGKDSKVNDLTINILPKTEITNSQPQVYSNTITITETGIYYFGIHCISDPDKGMLSIDDISIKEAAISSAPDGITNFKIIPDKKGKLKAELEFISPNKSVNGQDINKLDKIQILRNNIPLTTFNNPPTGKLIKYIDTTPINGANIYTVVAYNEAGAGKAVNQTAFVGEDEPAQPTNSKAQLIGNDVYLTWTISDKGFNGERVNPESVSVTIYSTPDGISRNLIAENVQGSEYLISGGNNQSQQQQLSYQIIPASKGGRGKFAYTNPVIVGKPYSIPFYESMANKKLKNTYWAMDKSSDKVGVFATSEAADGDNGAFILKSSEPNQILSLQTGKITLKDNKKAFLTFYHKAIKSPDETLKIHIIKDGEILHTLKTIDYKESKNEWTKETFNISNLTNETYFQIAFEVDFGEIHNSILLDNISITSEPITDGVKQILVNNLTDNAAIYTTMGIKVNTQNKLPKGIYIRNGKKIIIK